MVFNPWRRFFARTLDILICSTLWKLILIFMFHVNLATRSSTGNLFDSFAAFAVMLFLEPLLLNFFKTTPGKAIFGLKIETPEGRRLSYKEGLERTWHVIGSGLGYNIPIYNLVRLWKSYKICSGNEIQLWDDSISYTIKDVKRYRSALFIGAYAVTIAVMTAAISSQMLPPNRGDLTVPEFVENYNYYADFLGIDLGDKYLDENGKWAEKPFDGTVYIDTGNNKMPEYQYKTENGRITGVSFLIEINNSKDWVIPYNTQMILTALSFADAQKEIGLFSQVPNRIAKQINNNAFNNFSFIESGVEFVCNVEYSGYEGMSEIYLFPDKNAKGNYFKLQFIINELKH